MRRLGSQRFTTAARLPAGREAVRRKGNLVNTECVKYVLALAAPFADSRHLVAGRQKVKVASAFNAITEKLRNLAEDLS